MRSWVSFIFTRAIREHPSPIMWPLQLVVFVLIILFFVIVRARLSVDDPGKMQHMMEEIDSFITKQSHEVIGHGYERYVGYLTVLGIFILLGCLLGVIPGFESPTAIPVGAAGLRAGHLVLLSLPGRALERFRLRKEFYGSRTVAGDPVVSH